MRQKSGYEPSRIVPGERRKWRTIPGTKYEATRGGEIRRIGTKRSGPGRPLALHRGPTGYPVVTLRVDGKPVRMAAQCAVALPWLGEPPLGHAWRLIDPGRPPSLSNIMARPADTRESKGGSRAERRPRVSTGRISERIAAVAKRTGRSSESLRAERRYINRTNREA